MSDPPDAPPDSGLPEGVSLETASGVAVLRVSFDGDDERARRDAEERARMARAERDERAETTVLRHPETNVPVEIIGTAHVSALAARQTRELILRTKPDVVVLELDPNRLASMLRDAQLRTPARHLAETNVQTHLDALRVLYRGRTVQVIGGLAYAAVGAVLGSTPGAEFLAAIDAAKETGATVALGDADANVTTKRLFARTKWRKALRRAADRSNRSNRSNRSSPVTERSESDAERAPPLGDDATKKNKTTRAPVSVTFPDGSERPAPVATPEAAVRLMADAGCDARGAERGAWHLVMHADPDPEDLLAVRACAAKVVELVRSEAYLEKHGTFDGDVTCTETETETETEKTMSGTPTRGHVSYSGGWAMDQTLRADRDLVLAHSLYKSASGAVSKNGDRVAPRRVVGVVGAAHVRGVKREWRTVREQSSVNRFDSALALTPEECTLEGARLRFGRDAVGWWDQPGYSETAAAAAAGLGVLGLSGFGARRAETTSVQNAFATRVSSRLNRAAWFGVASVVGAGVVGTALTAHAMVELGRFAAKLERAAMAAEASGLAAPKQNELRSERWFETDALGRSVKNVFVDAVNVARPYETRGGRWGEDDVER
jgi:pheromone shutdown protein TraB